jgi:hypothetical protein
MTSVARVAEVQEVPQQVHRACLTGDAQRELREDAFAAGSARQYAVTPSAT